MSADRSYGFSLSPKNQMKQRPLGLEALESRVVLATRIVTIGDSWASFVADEAPGSIANVPANTNAFQQMLNVRAPGTTVYNGGFYGGTAAQHATQLGQITSIINAAGPDVDIVYLSSGGNDFLAGLLAGGWYRGKPAGEVQALFDAVGGYVQTVANHILSIRPDLQVVIPSYDYINVWDFNMTSGGDNVRFNLGLARSGNWAVDLLQNADMNAALRDLETRKANIGAGNSRIHHVNLYGQLHALSGYQGHLSNNVNLPPGSWPDLPVRRSLLGSSGNDPIHLTDAGYYALVDAVYTNFLSTALQNGQLGVNTNSINFGTARVGTTTGTSSVLASNVGANFTKVESLSFPVASGSFVGTGGSANPLFRDPTLGSDTASASYAFAPTARGNANANLSITSGAGNQSLNLSGLGVGPVYAGPASLALGTLRPAASTTSAFNVSNVTTDGNLESLTNLTLLSYSITGPDADKFALDGFTPGMVLTAEQVQSLTARFTGASNAGSYSATLNLVTDQNAAFGNAGTSFAIALGATVNDGFLLSTGPDPDNPSLTSLFAQGWNGDDAIRFAQLAPTTIQVTVTKENGVTVERIETFSGITGRVIALGAEGNDSLSAESLTLTSASLAGGLGNDTLFGSLVADGLAGDSGDDVLYGSSGADLLDGGDDADLIYGEHLLSSNIGLGSVSLGTDTIHGGEGNDTLYGDGDGGEGAPDLIYGDDGDDTIVGDGTTGRRTASDTIYGGDGEDAITGDADGAEGAPDSLYGEAGNDLINTSSGSDYAEGGNDDDVLLGGDGGEGANDTLIGDAGRDILVGDRGIFTGGSGASGTDSLVGGAGEDILIAGVALLPSAGAYGAIRAEWSSARTYGDRVANILGTGVGPRLNGDTLFAVGATVTIDNASPPATLIDDLLGGDDTDWFFREAEDNLVDLSFGEIATLIVP